MAPADGGPMNTLQSHIEDMRSSTNCKICLKPFYEPYILACGHTYCYSCLRSWFSGPSPDGPRNNKNCPDCRAPVTVQPAPNYAIRDITHMFIQRTELIAEDESVDEHAKDMKVEAEILNKDRNGPGLFRGIFKARPGGQLGAWTRHVPIIDHEDNVIRCPICTFEIVDGFCSGCGFDIESHDLDMSDFYDTEDDEDSDGDSVHSIPDVMARPPVRIFNLPQLDSDEDDSDEDQSDLDQYDEHDDFIDNENEDDADDIDNTSETHAIYGDNLSQSSHATTVQDDYPLSYQPRRSRRRVTIVPDFDEDSSADSPTNYDDSDNEVESEALRPVSESPRLTRSLRRRPIVISDDEDEPETFHNANERATTSEDGSGSGSSEDSSEMSSNASDDDDENGNEHENENEEESDDTAIPPQSGRSRHERLVNHRARRPDKTASRSARSSTNTASRPQTSRPGFAAGGNGRISGRVGATSRSTYVY